MTKAAGGGSCCDLIMVQRYDTGIAVHECECNFILLMRKITCQKVVKVVKVVMVKMVKIVFGFGHLLTIYK